jgi:polygalacturonase
MFLCQLTDAKNITITVLPKNPKEATAFIQSEIDNCSQNGGGKVTLPASRFVCGTIILKSGVGLIFPKNCEMIGDTNPDLFPLQNPINTWYLGKEGHHHRALIYAENAQNISLEGKGILDAQGEIVFQNWISGKQAFRWMLFLFTNCENIKVKGLTMKNSPSWMQLYQGCRNLEIKNILVENFGAKNNDGLDLDACEHVKISNCKIDSDDDALVIKSLSPGKMNNIFIKNCTLSSNCNAFKTGTESQSSLSNIRAKNIQITTASKKSRIYNRQVGLAAVALTMVDGGRLENVILKNFRIKGYKVPIFIRQGKRNRTHLGFDSSLKSSRIDNITFRKFQIKMESDIPNHITAVDSGSISNLNFKKIHIDYQPIDSICLGPIRKNFEENPKAYPEATGFKNALPLTIWYLRNVQKARFSSIKITKNKNPIVIDPKFVFEKSSGIFFE